ncbi:sodium:alanine symporter family protein [uncultured Dialister sp.]|jgi:AGCS family alanine or glycine:cation symporter|uniref:alanine/glycine:cation symporter family protein n=1 Tax=uncultured Dialister sp. TaxID=278064 RepID=UPI0025D5F1FC|nr:sodium:alanine symporter family protein [uncultured Dialister sp.]
MLVDVLNQIDSIVWGPWLLILLVGTGVFLSCRLGFLQVMKLPRALKLIFFARNKGDGDIDSFKALCTALAATVGTGNIVGVATAIKLGGPGALFWMWLAAFFGMATKFSEGCLAVKFRQVDDQGNIAGGPMYYIEMGLGKKWKPLAVAFALFGIMTAMLGSGTTTQMNAIVSSVNAGFGVSTYITCAIVTILVAIITFGGLQSISKTASKIVPAMAVIYFIITVIFLIMNASEVPHAVGEVISGAFNGTAAAGGFAGAGIMLTIRSGIARGLYSNESGLGSAPIVAAAAKTKWPAEQGLISMTGTFIDTIIICTLTGLTIIVSGVWTGTTNGAEMTQAAFATTYGSLAPFILTISLTLFAFTTIIGWNYYGERCWEYLFGTKTIKLYRIGYIAILASAVFLKLEAIWSLADIVNGLMAIPNLIALLGLSGVITAETKKYFNHLAIRDAKLKAYKARRIGKK